MTDSSRHEAIPLKGVPGSPYTRKMLALLRYRRLPYRLLAQGHGTPAGMPRPKVELLPTFYLRNAAGALEAVVDSTPIIRRLEREYDGRSVIPADPAICFLDELLEDYADEWLTKAMFHYRWHHRADIDKAGEILPRWQDITAPEETVQVMRQVFSERQIRRLYVVGSNATTTPVIEASYLRFLELFEAHLQRYPFLLGGRPGAADFAAFGQLTQLTHFDPTPMALTLEHARRVYAWVEVVEDLSGLEPADDAWVERDALPDSVLALLREVGRVYMPVMLANARAIASGSQQVETEVDGRPWVQTPFPYQAKCLQWLRATHARLDDAPRACVDAWLEETGTGAIIHGRLASV